MSERTPMQAALDAIRPKDCPWCRKRSVIVRLCDDADKPSLYWIECLNCDSAGEAVGCERESVVRWNAKVARR